MKVSLSNFLNGLNALVFIGALIYFIATVAPTPVPLGDAQSFCQCSPMRIQQIISTEPTASCIASVKPSTNPQKPGEYQLKFLTLTNTSKPFFYQFSERTGNSIKPVVFSKLAIERTDVQNGVQFPDMGDDFVYWNSEDTNYFEWLVNISHSNTVIVYNNITLPLTMMYYFQTDNFEILVIKVLNYDNGAFTTFEQWTRECVIAMDSHFWQSACICPLNVISNAVAIASITLVFSYAVTLYDSIATARKQKKTEDALSA